jgi:hypothetical protein
MNDLSQAKVTHEIEKLEQSANDNSVII